MNCVRQPDLNSTDLVRYAEKPAVVGKKKIFTTVPAMALNPYGVALLCAVQVLATIEHENLSRSRHHFHQTLRESLENERRQANCFDGNSDASYCSLVKKYGYCEKQEQYKDFLIKSCMKTCGMCQAEGLQCGVPPLKVGALGGSRIIAGFAAQKSFWPWQVAIKYNNKFICGGSLIDPLHVLSAAHCFGYRDRNATRYTVVLGEHILSYNENTEQIRGVRRIVLHEQFVNGKDDHDLALIELLIEAEMGLHVQPICLPKPGVELAVGTKCFITGWGSQAVASSVADILQEVEVPIVDPALCKATNSFNFRQVTDRMVCAGYKPGTSFVSACHGDSGGPLACASSTGTWTLYGVVSWGSPRCDGLDRYTVFTKVSFYVDWIDRQM